MLDDPFPCLDLISPPQALTNLPRNDDIFDLCDIVINDTLANNDSLGQTFTTPWNSNFGSHPSSTYSSPAYNDLGDDFDADDLSPQLSPYQSSGRELWAQDSQFLCIPHVPSSRSSDSGGSSHSSLDSSIDGNPGLRRHRSASSLDVCRNDQQVMGLSQNVGTMSIEDDPICYGMGPRGGPEASLSSGTPLYGSSTAFNVPIRTPILDGLPYPWSPAPSPGSSSPISQSSSLSPTDTLVGNDNATLVRARSKKSIEASLKRRKSSGPGKFVCHICRDDFTTKHRLKGHVASKHEGKKITCPSCSMVLSHGTSYDRHRKRTCQALHQRDRLA